MTSDASDDLRRLTTEIRHQATGEIDLMRAQDIARVMNSDDALIARAVEHELRNIGLAMDGIVARLRDGGRLLFFGAGSSGRLGVLAASECSSVFSTSTEIVVACIAGGMAALTRTVIDAEDDKGLGRRDAEGVRICQHDALIAISASGRTPYTKGAAAFGREQGALTIALVCNATTPIGAIADITIAPIVGPEVIAGSTGLKAGTAQKMVLDMLTSGAMILLGKTYMNLMVDLPSTSAKMRRRAIDIVQQTTGLAEEDAAATLAAAGGELKTAIVAAILSIDANTARKRLAAVNYVVRNAIR